MANKGLKSIKFPSLPDTYKVPPQAADFSTSTSYAVGDYCIYQGALYRFTTAHTGAWNASHVAAANIAEEVARLVAELGMEDEDQEIAIRLILNELLHRDELFDGLSGTVTSQGGRITTLEGKMTSAEGNITKLLARTTIEAGTVTLTNDQAFPFNNSQVTVPLVTERANQNYIVDYEVTAATGNVGDIIISAKLVNGFKIEHTGSATSVTVKYQVLGGMA